MVDCGYSYRKTSKCLVRNEGGAGTITGDCTPSACEHGEVVLDPRLRLFEVTSDRTQTTFCAEVDTGLRQSPKSLPTRYLYDHEGSELFESITDLPEYYLTRCETQILRDHADEIIRECGQLGSIIEFGSGSSKKTRLILEAALRAQGPVTYVPIDISSDFLHETATNLLNQYPELSIDAVSGEYFDVADALPVSPRPLLILFLGSNIGNLTLDEGVDFMARVGRQMRDGDHFLLGIDLVKDPAIIEAAYNDKRGVTGAFNLNLLARINRELNANFDVSRFAHRAPYLENEHRVEMRLYSLADQVVEIEGVGRSIPFAEGEFIHTEWSHKYTLESFGAMAARAGLEIDETWLDDKQWFALVTLKRKA